MRWRGWNVASRKGVPMRPCRPRRPGARRKDTHRLQDVGHSRCPVLAGAWTFSQAEIQALPAAPVRHLHSPRSAKSRRSTETCRRWGYGELARCRCSRMLAHAALECALPSAMMIMAVLRDEVVEERAGGVGIGRAHRGNRRATLDQRLIELEGFQCLLAVELRLAVCNQLAAVGDEQR